MGLDGVELLMEIEKTFSISIPDYEAEKIMTVGDLHECVWRHVEKRENEKCVSAFLFYKIRRFFIEQKMSVREDFNVHTSLNAIVEKQNRNKLRVELKKQLDVEMPLLVLPSSLAAIELYVNTFLTAGICVLLIIAVVFFDVSKFWFLILVLTTTVAILLSRFLNPYKIEFEQKTVAQFIEKIIQLNYSSLNTNYGMRKNEIIKVINLVIQDKMGVELNEIVPEAHLVYDLGIN